MGRWMMGAAMLASVLMLASCKKGEGATCYKAADCDEGLVCVGEDVRRCESCAASEECKESGLCTAKNNRCVK